MSSKTPSFEPGFTQPVTDCSEVFRLDDSMMFDGESELAAFTQAGAGRSLPDRTRVAPARVAPRLGNRGPATALRHPPGVIRRLMAEVANEQYDPVFVYKHLQHLDPDSPNFRETYMKLRLEKLAKSRQAAPQMLSMAQKAPMVNIPWEVRSIADLFALAGLWVALLGLAQPVVAWYLAHTLGPIEGFSRLELAAAITTAYLAADGLAYLIYRGRLIAKWLTPGLWLAAATLIPAAVAYFVRNVLALG